MASPSPSPEAAAAAAAAPPAVIAPATPPRKSSSALGRVLSELGLASLWRSTADVKLLCAQRLVRMLGYGASTLVLVAYLDALGHRKTEIGLFMTLTLAGDIGVSFALTLFADALGRRAVLALGALLMAASGLAFAFFRSYWVLLLAAVVGVISPNGNEIGPFRAIEESIVAQLTVPENRSDIYAWYSLSGLAGAAFGLMICGWILQFLTGVLHWDLLSAYRAIYLLYAAIGLVKLCLTLFLSHSVEAEKEQQQQRRRSPESSSETAPLLDGGRPREGAQEIAPMPTEPRQRTGLRRLIPDISRESAFVVTILCFLFGLDAFGTGVNPLSWITYYFQWRFDIEKGELGSIFFVTQIIAAISMLVASSIAKRLGNVKTMVLTHLPSQVFRALIGVPGNVHMALLFLVLNASTASMDTAPRSAFLATIIPAGERTAVMGTLNVVKTATASLGPIITGVLVDRDLYWVSFVLGGSLKGLYDVGILVFFRQRERERERSERDRIRRQQEEEEGDGGLTRDGPA
ncbi:putative MFS transporter [Rosellinia necatrix]|uniref:Putative MFS transporter n=1 Tax=Rosellinia necatrix TaxID=77044 RepID=A0A1W2TGA1_ROSNE|nr:putative MFS transporter [Rosellinia necatrix]